jgi:ubiquinone/menaquinone biosynthesis C-methylase UbiE
MSAKSQVASYFDRVAPGYQSASDGPVWGYLRRREAVRLMADIGDVKGLDVLELGSGAGYYTRLLLKHGARHVHAVDISQRMLDELPKDGVTPILADATEFDPGQTFSLLVSAGMLEFVPRPAQVLRNASRYAKPGARLVILYPRRSLLGRAYRRFHARNGMTIRLFDRSILESLSSGTGWRVDTVAPAGPYSATAVLVAVGR